MKVGLGPEQLLLDYFVTIPRYWQDMIHGPVSHAFEVFVVLNGFTIPHVLHNERYQTPAELNMKDFLSNQDLIT
jgi:hypothetical protein